MASRLTAARPGLPASTSPMVFWRATSRMAPALLAIVLLGLWTRVQYIDLYGGRTASYNSWADEHYFGGLSVFYLSTSDALAAGDTYTALHHPPGYSYFLAALKTAGVRSIGAIRLVQSVIDAAVVVVVYGLARSLVVSRAWALAASAMYAVWPLFAAGSTWLLAESLSVALLATVLMLLVWVAQTNTQRGVAIAAICGIVIGLSALIRPDFLLLIVPAAAWTVFTASDRMRHKAVTLVLAFAIPLGVWGVHNRTTQGVWVFGSTSSGLGLWEGLGEQPNSYGYILDDSAANHVLMANGLTWASIDADRYFRREYLKALSDHPAFVARVIAARIPRILFHSERLQPLFFGRARQLADASGALLVMLAVWLRCRQRVAWLLLLLPPLYALGSIGLVHYEPRYVRYVQLSYIFAAIVLANDAWRRLSDSNRAVAVAAASIIILVSGWYATRELYALHVAATMALAR